MTGLGTGHTDGHALPYKSLALVSGKDCRALTCVVSETLFGLFCHLCGQPQGSLGSSCLLPFHVAEVVTKAL